MVPISNNTKTRQQYSIHKIQLKEIHLMMGFECIWCWDSSPQPITYLSPPITTISYITTQSNLKTKTLFRHEAKGPNPLFDAFPVCTVGCTQSSKIEVDILIYLLQLNYYYYNRRSFQSKLPNHKIDYFFFFFHRLFSSHFQPKL